MQRNALERLIKWKDMVGRKPLIIEGVRQVGKTWLMKEFGKRCFPKTAYFMFERNDALQSVFQGDLSPKRIIEELGFLQGAKITPETLVIFDEVQECPLAVTALKYLCEECPEYPIVAAGSYLGLATHRGLSFPVGKVDFLTLRPFGFEEFLSALGADMWRGALENGEVDSLRVVHGQMMDLVRKYLYIGGMPEVVADYAGNRDMERVRKIQKRILTAYRNDFSKHIPSIELAKVDLLWQSIPAQLSKENRKFVYGAVKKGARAKDFENAIAWLRSCGLIHQVSRVKKPGLPLTAYADFSAFKLFLSDVGLLSAMSNLPARVLLGESAVLEEFKGALAEQFVLQEMLCADGEKTVCYWTNDSSTCEIDFLVQGSESVIPVEVKSGINLKAKSLKAFVEKFRIPRAVRFSGANYKDNELVLDMPLYGVASWVRTLFLHMKNESFH